MKAIIKITNKNEKNIFFIINSKINEHVKKYKKINIAATNSYMFKVSVKSARRHI